MPYVREVWRSREQLQHGCPVYFATSLSAIQPAAWTKCFWQSGFSLNSLTERGEAQEQAREVVAALSKVVFKVRLEEALINLV